MTSRRVVFLHVGPPKTGTSFLQSVLWAAKPQLHEQGLTLPMESCHDHLAVAHDVRERELSPKVTGALDRFVASVKQVDVPRALFSMEVIVGATPEQIERLYTALTGFDIHIIITARDLARLIPAAWQQSVRRRSDESYEQYLRAVLDDSDLTHAVWRRQDIAEIARRWGGSLPPDHVHVVTVPPPGAPQRLLLERFCSVIGVDPARIDTDVARTNPSLHAPQAELLRRVNGALGDRLPGRAADYHQLVNAYFAMTVLAAQSGSPLKLPMRYAERTRELYERMAKEIRDQAYDVVGDLADLEPTVFTAADAADLVDLDAGDANVAEAGVQALAAVLGQRHQDLELIRELREQATAARAAVTSAREESWMRRQRRRVATVGRNPSVLVDRLRRPRARRSPVVAPEPASG